MTRHLDSELLRTFVAIADGGSFTRAAEMVGRTQSAVSLQVKKLEAAAGEALFARGARGVGLTPAGERLLTHSRRILRLLDEAADSLREETMAGPVRVGVPEEYSITVLPDVLARFAERHPGVELTVRCETSQAFAPALDRGELDVAVIVSDQGAAHGEILMHDPTVWVTSTRHLAHEEDPLPLAMFERGCWWRDWALRALDEHDRRYRLAYSSASVAGIQAAIACGLAVGVLSQSTLPPGTRRLGADEGFTELPGSNIVLRRRANAPAPAESMAAAIRDAFQTSRYALRAA